MSQRCDTYGTVITHTHTYMHTLPNVDWQSHVAVVCVHVCLCVCVYVYYNTGILWEMHVAAVWYTWSCVYLCTCVCVWVYNHRYRLAVACCSNEIHLVMSVCVHMCLRVCICVCVCMCTIYRYRIAVACRSGVIHMVKNGQLLSTSIELEAQVPLLSVCMWERERARENEFYEIACVYTQKSVGVCVCIRIFI